MGPVKIRELRVKDVLHYHDFTLDLSDSGSSFHVLHGPNETGKTTLLSLIVDALYGGQIPEASKSRYDSHSRLYATLERADGSLCHIERKRRYSQLELVLGSPELATPEVLSSFLAGYQRERFTLLFGFDHERLRAGGQSLLDSQGQVGMSLFEAGSGIQHLHKLLEALSTRMAELLQPGFNAKSAKAINKLWQQYTQARQSMRGSALRAEDWLHKRQEIADAEAELARTLQQREDTAAQTQKVARLVRVRPLLAERAAMDSDIKAANLARPVPAAEIVQIKELWEQYRQARHEAESLERRAGELRGKLQNLAEDPAALDVSGAINALTESVQQYLTLHTAIPGEQESLQLLQTQAERQLRDLAPSVRWADMGSLRISPAIMDHMEALLKQIGEAQQAVAAEERDLSRAIHECVQAHESLDSLGRVVDVSALESVIRGILESGDVNEQIRQAGQAAVAKREEMVQRIGQQGIYHGSWDRVMDIPVPLQATADSFAKEWAAVQAKMTESEQARESLHKDLKEVEKTLAELNVHGAIPSEVDLQQARSVRNNTWDKVRRSWLAGAEGDHEQGAAEFDSALARADQVADLMIQAADRLAKRDIQRLRRQYLFREIEENQANAGTLQEVFAALQQRWVEEWPAETLTVKSPSEMREWLAQFWEPLLRLYHEHQDSLRAEHRLQLQQELSLQQLVEEAHRAQYFVGRDLPLSDVLRLCETYVEKHMDLATRQKHYQEQWAKAKVKKEEQQNRIEAARQLSRQLGEQWNQLVMEHPALPSSPVEARHYTQYLKDLLHSRDLWEQAEGEVRQHENVCVRFEQEARNTAKLLGEDVRQFLSVEAWVRHARDRVQSAQNTRRQIDDIKVELGTVEEQLRSLSLNIEDTQDHLEESQQTYQVAGLDALMEYVTRSERLAELQSKKKALDDTIRQAADGIAAPAIARALEAVADPDTLQAQQEGLQEQLLSLQEQYDRQRDALKELQAQFAHLGEAGNKAAAFAEESQGYLGEIDQLWNEYLRTALAKRMLEQAIESFRAQNESSILKRAGEYFRLMTKSRYRELTVNYDGEVPYLEAVHGGSGTGRRLAQLSDGTRDQLFLALRLAFLGQHLEGSEPLPLIMDDILVHFDDERTWATLEILQELSKKTQIIYFTHHQAVVDAAKRLQAHQGGVAIHDLGAALAGGVPS